ncbi:cation transporter [Planomonospora venezuelensis]|uniref:Divalent metal cation (Fe/Co/Zn/Cd) transporter n=1 Tax=Planomonospora venezuelensis TaxID=1999 RepID=A0A841CYF9_PLAVE|nr:cation transporter [Planomonospora venezuelensis]MBB5962339.1 divalent metal cation (Fe/Co/Zn/Cd) transporter [Planomonospora venezuelensis]GIN00719.1 membrane protein [Planomonospora venezuelensis]
MSKLPDVAVHGTGVVPAEAWLRDARRARTLSLVTLGWLGAESALGIAAGLWAHSVALIGWGVWSLVEALASLIVVWRFTGSRTRSAEAEERARKAVAVSFWLLAPYLLVHVVHDLDAGHRAAPSALGAVVTAVSLVSMPLLGVAKRRLGARLHSAATAGEGTQNLMCAALAAGVLAGLVLNDAGWWWADPAMAVCLAATAVWEGRKAWHGHTCCH